MQHHPWKLPHLLNLDNKKIVEVPVIKAQIDGAELNQPNIKKLVL